MASFLGGAVSMGTNSRRFHKNNEFPNEAFVQQTLEAYFTAEDFQIEQGSYSDLVCRNGERGQRWIIEAKGQTTAVGLDFRTGLGQLLQAMQDPGAFYGMAVPNTSAYIKQCRKVSDWVRQILRLHWLLIDQDGTVRIIPPDQTLA
jgi:formylglycine-generating enzyme required for sulfatase activity